MSEPSQPSGDDMERLEELRRELRTTRQARLAAEKRAQGVETTRLAVAAAARDRDVVTSPELEAARERATALAVRLRSSWQSIDRTRVRAGRLIATGVELETDTSISGARQLMSALAEEEQRRADVEARLAEAGITWFEVPKPASLLREQHPHRDQVRQLMDQALEEWRQREARARRPGRRRADFLPREG
ncbi:hypothetical protein [Actinomadura sp. 3N407]|uniref:hypothetical protein n=1 Tax=Actinomadura sp. 3N407 TaxID=3457423 RepID=UPI003FCEA03E